MERIPRDALLIPELLEGILEHLDRGSMYNSRRVCGRWNEVAIPLISKYNPPQIKMSTLKSTGQELSTLASILTCSQSVPVLFQRLRCPAGLIIKSQFQHLLKHFGWALKVLRFEESQEYSYSPGMTFSLIRSLVQHWCPNLEELTLGHITTYSHLNHLNDNVNLEEFHELQLKRLVLRRVGSVQNIHFLSQMCRASPSLKCLESEGDDESIAQLITQVKLDKFEQLIFNSQSNCELIMEKLMGSSLCHLTSLSLIFFQTISKDHLSRLLFKLRPSLLTLSIRRKTLGWTSKGNDHTTPVNCKTHLADMPKLKVFENYADGDYRLERMDFLEKMRNVERVVISGSSSSYLQDGRADILLSTLSSDPEESRSRHPNLKELVIFGSINSHTTLASIAQLMPNLRNLFIVLGHKSPSSPSVSDKLFTNSIQHLSQMKNLNILHLELGDFQWTEEIELSEAFQKFNHFPNLNYLRLVSGKGTMGSQFMCAMEKLLAHPNQLRRLTLINFKIEEQDKSQRFLEHCATKSGISLHFSNLYLRPMQFLSYSFYP